MTARVTRITSAPTLRRIGLGTLLVPVMVGGLARPALADPARPSNYESIVEGIDPATDAADFEVTGGDAFLMVTVRPGHSVAIPGYFGEPYIRVDPDGGVWVNRDSPALYINEDRFGDAAAPPGVDGIGEPTWEQAGSDGVYAWHDHRSHWMSRDLPPTVAGDTRQTVFPWEIPVTIDGVDSVVSGELVWIPSAMRWSPVLAGVIALLALTFSPRKWMTVMAFLAAVAATIGVVVVVAQNAGTPAVARGLPVEALVPGAALLVATLAITRGRLATLGPPQLLFVAGAVLVVWALSHVSVLWLPVLVSAAPPPLERVAVAFVAWAGVGVVVAAVRMALDQVRS